MKNNNKKIKKFIKKIFENKIFDFAIGVIMLTVTIEGIKNIIFGLKTININ
jgi:hypothetical protein